MNNQMPKYSHTRWNVSSLIKKPESKAQTPAMPTGRFLRMRPGSAGSVPSRPVGRSAPVRKIGRREALLKARMTGSTGSEISSPSTGDIKNNYVPTWEKPKNSRRKEPLLYGWVDPLSLEIGELDGVYEAGVEDIIGTIVGRDMSVTFQDGYTKKYELSLERKNGRQYIQANQNGYKHYILEGVKPSKKGHQLYLRDIRTNAKKRSSNRLYTWKPIRKINTPSEQSEPITESKKPKSRGANFIEKPYLTEQPSSLLSSLELDAAIESTDSEPICDGANPDRHADPLVILNLAKMGKLDGVYQAGACGLIGSIIGPDMTITFQDGYTVEYKMSLGKRDGQLCVQANQRNYQHYVIEGVKVVEKGYQLSVRDTRNNAKKRSTGRLYTWKPMHKTNANAGSPPVDSKPTAESRRPIPMKAQARSLDSDPLLSSVSSDETLREADPLEGSLVDPLTILKLIKMNELDSVYEAGTHDIIGSIVGRDMKVTFNDGHTLEYELSLGKVDNGRLCIQAHQQGYQDYVLEGVKPVGKKYQLFVRDMRTNAKKSSNGRLYTWKPLTAVTRNGTVSSSSSPMHRFSAVAPLIPVNSSRFPKSKRFQRQQRQASLAAKAPTPQSSPSLQDSQPSLQDSEPSSQDSKLSPKDSESSPKDSKPSPKDSESGSQESSPISGATRLCSRNKVEKGTWRSMILDGKISNIWVEQPNRKPRTAKKFASEKKQGNTATVRDEGVTVNASMSTLWESASPVGNFVA